MIYREEKRGCDVTSLIMGTFLETDIEIMVCYL